MPLPRIPHQPKILVGRVFRFGKWEDISIEQALEQEERHAHCPECNGLLRNQNKAKDGSTAAHFEHQHEDSSCSLCYTYKAQFMPKHSSHIFELAKKASWRISRPYRY